MKTIVAMSGGVDSSVAAYELKKSGKDLIGITIKTWPKDECGMEGEKLCCSLESIQYARSVAEDLGIPFYVVDFSGYFEEHVRKYFIQEYKKGRTPNPCVHCNSEIKFGALMQKAKELNAGDIATGHYARIKKEGGDFFLYEAKEKQYDQSYFLYNIAREKLKYICFPIGEMKKTRVREIALKQNLTTANRKASQDICFVYDKTGGYKKYLMKNEEGIFAHGEIIDESGKVLGEHNGIASYTIGQRRGIGIARGKPVYVLKIDKAKNTITVGDKGHAMKRRRRVADINWLVGDKNNIQKCGTRIRYRGEKAETLLFPLGENEVIAEFKKPLFAPTPGQSAVFYDGDLLLGGGTIEETLE